MPSRSARVMLQVVGVVVGWTASYLRLAIPAGLLLFVCFLWIAAKVSFVSPSPCDNCLLRVAFFVAEAVLFGDLFTTTAGGRHNEDRLFRVVDLRAAWRGVQEMTLHGKYILACIQKISIISPSTTNSKKTTRN